MKLKFIPYILSSLLLLTSCHKNVMTGRRGLNLMPESTMRSMATQQYATFLTSNKPVKGTKDQQMVQRVGQRISYSVNEYLNKRGQSKLIEGYKWEFNLVDENQANAWCMPGGKVVFYTGILPITQNENGVAVVMGHEIAHAIARHGNERMSQQVAAQGLSMAGNIALASSPQYGQYANIFNQAIGIGSQMGILAYSRKHESEADNMGLKFMAMAGYNPTEAVAFWTRMKNLGGQKPPAFLSTHPDDDKRIADIKSLLPEAMKYYRPRNRSNTSN